MNDFENHEGDYEEGIENEGRFCPAYPGPIDFSSCSGDALRFAHSLASDLSASIEVLHVMDPSGTMLDSVADRPSGGDPAPHRACFATSSLK